MLILVCDGAAPNLAALKASFGMYGGPDPYAVRPWFVSPCDPPNLIY